MLEARVKELAKGKNFAALTTLQADGQPVTHVMWVDCDDECLLLNTEVHRRKFAHVEADPRVAVMIWDAESPYRYVDVRGRVVGTITGPEARAHIDDLAHKYTGNPYRAPVQSERVVLRVEPVRQRVTG